MTLRKDHSLFLDHLFPDGRADSLDASPLPWPQGYMEESFAKEQHLREVEFDTLTAASTPLFASHENMNLLFTSPLRKFDRLNLSQSSSKFIATKGPDPSFDTHTLQCKNVLSQAEIELPPYEGQAVEYRTDLDYSSNEQGNATFVGIISSHDADDGHYSEPPLCDLEAPTFIRKRKLGDPLASSVEIPMALSTSAASICHYTDMSWIIPSETNDLHLKLSFSTSYSTPCPSQPRKMLKLTISSQETTPYLPSKNAQPLLSLSSSKKLSVLDPPLLSKLNDVTTEDNTSPYYTSPASRLSTDKLKLSTMPISQSTPANSRANSPACFSDKSDEETKGHKIIKPSSMFKYQPRSSSTAPQRQQQSSCSKFNDYSLMPIGNYLIVGDFPVSAAGIMDEENKNVHIADKRIGDPYLSLPINPMQKEEQLALFAIYSESLTKLPLFEHFVRELTLDEMKVLINDGVSVYSFYEQLHQLSKLGLLAFLKKERLRWHPDKWQNRFDKTPFDLNVIVQLSQVINSLIAETS